MGKLEITVCEAKTLPDGTLSHPDVYCKIKFADQVHETPVVLQGLPEKVVVKQAAAVDLPVAFERRYGLAGDVQIEGAPGKPVAGLTVAPAAVPADQPAGVLKLAAAADSPPGTYDLVITTKYKFFDRDVSSQRTIPLVIEAAAPAAP